MARLVRNATALYARTGLVAGFALLTSRLAYRALGAADFGLIALMVGVVGIMAFVNAALAASVQRHLGVEIGRGVEGQVRRTFNAAFALHGAWACVLLLLAETIGLWAVTHVLHIPVHRQAAAFWVYQFTVAAALGYVLIVPYSALLMAREDISWTAALDVLRAALIFVAALFLPQMPGDRLLTYTALTVCISGALTLGQAWLCRRFYPGETKLAWKLLRDTSGTRELAGFSGWTIFGSGAFVARLQGLGLLLNIFIGLAANAAYGICLQVHTQVTQLTQGVLTAASPRILHLAGANRREEAVAFSFRAAKYAAFLAAVVIIPVLFEVPLILHLWLGEPPPDTAVFCRLVLAGFCLDQLSFGLGTLALALGRLARYQLVVGGIQLAGLPLAWLCLRRGLPPQWALAAAAFALCIAAAVRPWIVGQLAGFSVAQWARQVLLPTVLAVLPTAALCAACSAILSPGILRAVVSFTLALGAGFAAFYVVGMTAPERAQWRRWSRLPLP